MTKHIEKQIAGEISIERGRVKRGLDANVQNTDPRVGPIGGWLTTFTGKQFSFIDPQLDMIDIADIAHHLAMICHWNGACRCHFSVAQHSVCVSRIVPRELQPWALLHDAAEAYCGDMTRPLKALLPEYKMIEKRVLRVIAEKFGLPWPEPPELKGYDDQILKIESTMYMHPSEVLHDGRGHPVVIADLMAHQHLSAVFTMQMQPEAAELMFLSRYRRIFLDEDGL